MRVGHVSRNTNSVFLKLELIQRIPTCEGSSVVEWLSAKLRLHVPYRVRFNFRSAHVHFAWGA
jgi:hypothetical protein